jgi:hypothetical protein
VNNDATNSTLAEPEPVTSNQSIVINEALCYLQNSLDKYSTTNVKGTMNKFYTDCEIEAAKQVLFSNPFVSRLVPSVPSRKGNNRKVREIDDIVSAFLVVDEKMLVSSIPKFVAADLSRIPTYTQEEENVGGILARLSSLEKQLNEWKDITTSNNNKLAELEQKQSVSIVPPPPISHSTSAPSFAEALASGPQVLPADQQRRVPFRPRIVSIAGSEVSYKRKRDDDEASNNSWQKPKPKRRGKTGKREDCGLSGGESLFEIFVSHLTKSTTSDDLTNFLTKESVKVISIVKTSHDDANFASYKVKVERANYEKLCGDEAPSFWPVNVMCRPFIAKNNRQSGGTLS